MMRIITARNVNDAFHQFKLLAEQKDFWNFVAPRGKATMEHIGPVVTEYSHPNERVLFDQARDANPFFHFFEALWILNGNNDVAYLEQFNSRMKEFSDDGRTFHGAYGRRLRDHFTRDDENGNLIEVVDQLMEVVDLLKREPDTRRAVMNIWDPAADLGMKSKDIPCNTTIFFKLRGEMPHLGMTVCCRSNDAVWGCYGTNVVQFSMIQEFVARALDAEVGVYRQISDSFHVYTEEAAYARSIGDMREPRELYEIKEVRPYPLFTEPSDYREWQRQLAVFLEEGTLMPTIVTVRPVMPFFSDVAIPMLSAWRIYRGLNGAGDGLSSKNERIETAQIILTQCKATDWSLACHRWLERRKEL